MTLLTLNAGSSSIKFALFDRDAESIMHGEIEKLGTSPHLHAANASGTILVDRSWPETPGFHILFETLLTFVEGHLGQAALAAVGHRIVHGGADHVRPALFTPAVLAELTALTPLDPLHMPLNLAPVHAVAAARPALPQVACFDTAFHHTLPPVAQAVALPRAVTANGVRRYGFHGLSYEYIAGRLAELDTTLAAGRVVVAHLGAGASLCALQGGVSIATTMGFSALDGLVMATRCGSLDPGVILYLGRQGHSFADIEDMLYRRSGLLGVSGISGDIRVLLTSREPAAAFALDLFCYRIACEAAALIPALGGLDGIVFTGGIGEHAPAIRAAVCARLAWLGVAINPTADAPGCISTDASAIRVLVIATNEEAMIARHTRTVLQEGAAR